MLDLVGAAACLVVNYGVVRPACSAQVSRCVCAGCLTIACPHRPSHKALTQQSRVYEVHKRQLIQQKDADSPFVEGSLGSIFAKAHDKGPARIPKHVVDLLQPICEQQRRILLVSLHM